ncbi:CaiB/BaiF CoA transferase family protein [Planctobacterium marinum]|uniref:CaiB/BaiF CoA transferase family protein n=1 Tax=Planctobacterium marinum TaxID=1631968 RepID=UPI001E377CD5|nr:CaiB/BaiF CoA-transferase family protein [Planctobacterium marinum]MCC2606890.1 CoA transferase [Planctobacterium marinum]
MKNGSQANPGRPLDGIRVIEFGQLLAGPFAGCILGYFGAEVIKVEPPGGDPIRGWREVQDGTSLWWRSIGRNKKSVTLDLKQQAGRDVAKKLLAKADVLIENFRPGVMENWGLGPEQVKALNPGLVYARISGFGQTGPYSQKPGFASVCEGISGFRHLNGYPGDVPVRPNLSLGDTISGIHAALGIALALIQRQKDEQHQGQVVDVALYESMFNLLEAVIPEYSGAGVVREASGTTVTGIVPTNTYCCEDGKYVVIGGNGDSIFKRLMQAAHREDLAEDPRLANNSGRVVHEAEIDAVLKHWCAGQSAESVLNVLAEYRVPAGPIYNAKDMMEDPHFNARALFESVEIDGKPLQIPAILPRLTDTPGKTDWPGDKVGSHNHQVFAELLGMDETELQILKTQGVIL